MVASFFPNIKPSLKARKAMQDAALHLGTKTSRLSEHEEVNNAIRAISRITNHKHVKLVSSGNAAILYALTGIDGKVMIPDQGGWKRFIDYPKLLGLDVCKIKTDLGLIRTDSLPEEIEKYKPKALILTSFAGYIAEQDVKDISKICREKEVMLVEDASGAVGDRKLADGRYSDIIVSSTGTPKILNLLTGGFISTNNREILDNASEIIAACSLNPIVCAGIVEELKIARQRIDALVEYSKMLKEELNNVIHENKRGVCAGIALKNNPKKLALKAREKGLATDLGKGFITPCPRYERFLKKGIVVELKNLDVLEMREEEIIKIADTLKSCME